MKVNIHKNAHAKKVGVSNRLSIKIQQYAVRKNDGPSSWSKTIITPKHIGPSLKIPIMLYTF